MSESSLVQINKNMNRRTFLKVLGAGAGAAATTGCADSSKQNVYPNVLGDEYQVPGVANWYSSTCMECSAGCGITVRNREGRSVKIEGNRENPVASGGLCGLGQSSLQALYNPDRIRQPLEKVRDGEKEIFKPITWKDAYKKVSASLKDAKGKFAYLSGETSGSLEKLLNKLVQTFEGRKITYDLLQPVAHAKASELAYGTYGIPQYNFDKCDVVLNFGADFLETWVNPCGFARGWAKARRKDHPVRVVHVEPRLSLTGANADTWLCNKPGSELKVALAVLKVLSQSDLGSNLSSEVLSKIKKLTKGQKTAKLASEAGVPEEKILLAARYLKEAKHSLVIAGGAAGSTPDALSLQVVVAFINLLLSNVGDTVDISKMRKPQSSVDDMGAFLNDLRRGGTELVFVHGTNPAYNLPSDHGFEYAIKEAKVAKAKADKADKPLLVSFATQLDETAELADIILPAHHYLEDWGDSVPYEGNFGLVQPTMTPLFDTRSLGDSILTLAADSGFSFGFNDYASYVKENWKELHGKLGVSEGFTAWWNSCVERGGYFSEEPSRVKVNVSDDAFAVDLDLPIKETKGAKKDSLHLMPYPSVKGFDGRSANRPWLQELPDPVTKVVWDSWAELHPDTAKRFGIAQGDTVTVRNHYGEVNVPAYVTEHIHKDVVAVPMGQGHTSYGRYAKEVESVGNVIELLPSEATASGGVALLGATVAVSRGRTKTTLVTTQQYDDQLDRELARTKYLDEGGHGDHGNGHHNGHHDVKQMYEQRVHPVYEWGLNVDLASCTGCGACVVACAAENNIPTVGKEVVHQGREMSWLRIERYFDQPAEELKVSFMPMMCQQCNNAPCEPVCPVYATYHNEEGLNAMVYNRCVGTRYCSNNCTYKVRRFNWYEFEFPEPMQLQLNPDVTKRTAGVMEKCTFCIQRIQEGKDRAKDEGRLVKDGEIQPACVQSCPTEALTFGNLNDKESAVSHAAHSDRAYKVLDHHINTQPSVSYQEDIRYKV